MHAARRGALMPLRWKVCGITRAVDAVAAVELGADAIGFVFTPSSPQAIEPVRAARIAAALPRDTWRFGVFADRPAGEINAVVRQVGLDFVQLEGDESPELVPLLDRHSFKMIRPRADWDERRIQDLADRYPECTLMVDVQLGNGESRDAADWGAAALLARWHRLVLAGGLTAEEVAEAVLRVRPWAVDASTGIESSPGVKDHGKLRAFARALAPFRRR